MPIVRKAELRDVPSIVRLINRYARKSMLLPRSAADVSENIQGFMVAEEDGSVVACGALKGYGDGIAEVRSLCVEPGRKSSGLGRLVTQRLLAEAERLHLKTVFALTLAPEFFQKCGFQEAPRENFPQKIWHDCLLCSKFFHCDEKTMSINLATSQATGVETRNEAANFLPGRVSPEAATRLVTAPALPVT